MISSPIQQMLDRYQCRTLHDHEQALREILQEIALVGLWRAKFFEHAAFYGGTALRIIYGLDRFSEDLDFTLLSSDPKWTWQQYGQAVANELSSYGFDASFVEKDKSTQTAIKSAFLKTPTVQELLKIGVHSSLLHGVHPGSIIRIKVEIDTDPPIGYMYEQKMLSQPTAVSIKCVTEECLFASKMRAALFRTWKGRVKGRDWFDVIWFLRRKTPFNLSVFSQLQGEKQILNREHFRSMVKDRIERLDIKAAIDDIVHFVKDQEAIQRTWSKEFFLHWFDTIRIVE